jgi:hypothetical protein
MWQPRAQVYHKGQEPEFVGSRLVLMGLENQVFEEAALESELMGIYSLLYHIKVGLISEPKAKSCVHFCLLPPSTGVSFHTVLLGFEVGIEECKTIHLFNESSFISVPHIAAVISHLVSLVL